MTHITFDSGLAGILRMGLDGQVYEFQEVLSLGDISHCADPRSRAQARQIIWRGYGDGKAAERRQMEINARLLSRAGKLAAHSEEITFWTSGSAADTCSLLFLLTRFPWGKAPLWAARFDRRDMAGLPDRVKDLCAQRQGIGREEHRAALDVWGRLVRENDPVRRFDGGRFWGEGWTCFDGQLLPALERADFQSDRAAARLYADYYAGADLEVCEYGAGFIAWRYETLLAGRKGIMGSAE